jgi:hypothetical protein
MPDIEGGCRCGAVRYRLDLPALPGAYACHCLNCQTWSGSAFSQQAVVAAAALIVTQGEPELYELTTPSGALSSQRVCGACHTRLFNTNSARPQFVVVRAGTLDESHRLDVVGHIWVRRKQPWIRIADGVPVWEESADPAAFAALVTPR